MKNMRFSFRTFALIVSLLLFSAHNIFAWNDETHLAIAKASGYKKWYNATGPDIAKIKAGFVEKYNHYFNNNDNLEVTAQTVLSQTKKYNNPDDSTGHLYGAIIASLREYEKHKEGGKDAEYHLAYFAHYIGDLSQPLHNTPHDGFNKERHQADDALLKESSMKNIVSVIKERIYPINLRRDFFEDDLAKEIARIANISRELGYKIRAEKRNITEEEAYVQISHSASLLTAVLKHLGKVKDKK
jgi:hypothetical protein